MTSSHRSRKHPVGRDTLGALRALVWGTALLCAAPYAYAAGNLQAVILDTTGAKASTLSIDRNGNVDLAEIQDGCALGANPMTGAPLGYTGRSLIEFGTRTKNVGSDDIVLGSAGCNCMTTFNCNPGFVCSQSHHHVHYNNFAGAKLADPSGKVVARSEKYGFCVEDLGPASCPVHYTCNYMGITAGCFDEYDAGLPCQFIDLTGYSLPAGQYTMTLTSDPKNKIPESNEGDNTDTATVTIPCTPGALCADANHCTPDGVCNASGACVPGSCGAGMACGDGLCDVPCVASSLPAVVSWGPGRLDVFWRGSNNALWHMWYDNGLARWVGPENLGGNVTGRPKAVSWAAGRLDIFYKGVSDHLIHRWWENGWSGEEDHGGNMGSDPAAVARDFNRLDVFFRGGGGGDDQSFSATVLSEPDVISANPNHLDVFWKNNTNDLTHKWWDGANWSANESFAASMTSPPSVIDTPGRIDAFWRNTNDDLVWKPFTGTWGSNMNLDGTVTSRPSVISWGTNHLDVYWKGGNDALKHKWTFDGGANWVGPEDLGGTLSSGPNAVSWGNGHVDVFWQNSSGFISYSRFIGGDWSARYRRDPGRMHRFERSRLPMWARDGGMT